jgi:hypothetical protein
LDRATRLHQIAQAPIEFLVLLAQGIEGLHMHRPRRQEHAVEWKHGSKL